MPDNADNIAQVEELTKLEPPLTDDVQLDVELQPCAIAQQMPKRSLSVRTQSDDPSRQTYLHALGGERLGGPSLELLEDLLRCVRRGKLVRVGRVTQGLDPAQLFAALQELVERFEFQGSVLSGDEAIR